MINLSIRLQGRNYEDYFLNNPSLKDKTEIIHFINQAILNNSIISLDKSIGYNKFQTVVINTSHIDSYFIEEINDE